MINYKYKKFRQREINRHIYRYLLSVQGQEIATGLSKAIEDLSID